jgi:hypothetical protein
VKQRSSSCWQPFRHLGSSRHSSCCSSSQHSDATDNLWKTPACLGEMCPLSLTVVHRVGVSVTSQVAGRSVLAGGVSQIRWASSPIGSAPANQHTIGISLLQGHADRVLHSLTLPIGRSQTQQGMQSVWLLVRLCCTCESECATCHVGQSVSVTDRRNLACCCLQQRLLQHCYCQ